MTVPMKARRAFPYAGKRLKAGTEFLARGESDARVLAAIGHAERVTVAAPAAPAPATYQHRMMTAAAPSAAAGDGLDTLDAEQLHAMAAQRGIKVHPMTGAVKLRAALRAAK